jgi:hypothetical protein
LAITSLTRGGAARLPSAGVGGGSGVAGGGTLDASGRAVGFVLFATRLESEGETEPQVFGALEWDDPEAAGGAVTLRQFAVDDYDVVGDDESVREASGTATVDGEPHPFVLRVVGIGEKTDQETTISLLVGSESAPIYSASGPITTGGVILLDFLATTP